MNRIIKPRVFILLLSFFIMLTGLNGIDAYASSDTEAPVIKSLTIDKTNVQPDDTITVTAEITDETDVKYIYVYFRNGSISKSATLYSQGDDKYSGTIYISNSFIDGDYSFWYIYASDSIGNGREDYSYSNLQFSVSGASSDTEAPVIKSLTIDKTNVQPDDTITVTAEITDETDVKYIYVYFRNGSISKSATLYSQGDDKYSGTIYISNSFIDGDYSFWYIYASDSIGNGQEDYSYSNLQFSVYDDVYGPELVDRSISANPASLSFGNVSIQASFTDYSKISSIIVDYERPINKTTESINLEYIGEDTYTGVFTPGEHAQAGVWKIKQITATDIKGNTSIYKNSNLYSDVDAVDMSAGDFEVTGTTSDMEAPVIEKASIKTNGGGELTTEENFHITLNATDALSGVKTVYVNYTKANGDKFALVLNKSEASGKEYFGSIPYKDPSDLGSWAATSIVAEDNAGNQTEVKDSNKELSFTFYCEIDRIERIANATVFKENTYVSYQTIQGDVYIGPNAVVTLDNVTVTGNIYVLGGARLISVSAGGVYGSSMSFGYSYGSTFYNGTIYFSGSNSVGTMVSSSTPVTDIPVEVVDGEATSLDGKLQIKGATLDIADFYIADNRIDISDDGKFVIKDIAVGNVDQVSLKWTTVFGNTIEKVVNVTKLEVDEDGNINYKPVLNASDLSVCIGQKIDLLKNVNAKDHEDGDLTNLITVSPETVATDAAKETKVKYTVSDSKGSKVEKTVTVTVRDHDWVNMTPIENSCIEDAVVEYYCFNCESSKTETIKAEGHEWSTDYWVDIAPTCTTDGSESIHCVKCNAVKDGSERKIEKYGHESYDHWTLSFQTCTDDGVEEYYCYRCGEYYKEALPATGHVYDWVIQDATCTADGLEYQACIYCGVKKEGSEQIIPAYGHDKVDTFVWTNPTCTEDGTMHHHCIRCGEEIFEPISATGHQFGAWYTVTEPTSSKTGVRERACTACGFTETESIDKLPPDGQQGGEEQKPDDQQGGEEQKPDDHQGGDEQKPDDPTKDKGEDGTDTGRGASAAAAEKEITSLPDNGDAAGASFAPLMLKSTKQGKSNIKLTWKKVSGTTKYVIYGNACGKTKKLKKLDETTGTSFNVKKIDKKLKKATYHKFMVVALDSSDHVVSTSKVIHVATKGKGNHTKITVNKKAKKNKVTLKSGKTFKLKGKASGRKVKKHVGVRYESSNPEIATVSGKGVIKGINTGKCIIFVYAQNGLCKTIKVTVK